MTRLNDNIFSAIKETKQSAQEMKSTQTVGSGDIATYEDSASVSDATAGTVYGYALFTAVTTSVQVISGFSVQSETLNDYYQLSKVSATLSQASTDKDTAKYESSWRIYWQKGIIGFDAITVTGYIRTTVPNTTSAQLETGSL